MMTPRLQALVYRMNELREAGLLGMSLCRGVYSSVDSPSRTSGETGI
jgi:hypothetical protein